MKKILNIIVIIVIVLFLYNFILLPKIDYSKLDYVSLSSFSNQSLDSDQEAVEYPEKTIIVQLTLDYQTFNNKAYNLKTNNLSAYKKAKSELRTDAKNYHKGNNENLLKGIEFKNAQEVYISNYSPFVDITYDYEYFMKHKENILSNVTTIDGVKKVNLIESSNNYKPCIDTSNEISNATDVYENRTKTGDGIVVGILEPGKVNKNHPNLSHTTVTIRSSIYNLGADTEHSTNMALIIAGENGIAPDATILSAYASGTLNAEIDWMIDNDVDIINMSFGYVEDQGIYNNSSAYCDYICYSYSVVMVAAAGNNGNSNRLVYNPGLGYNVITVGSVVSSLEASDFSSYDVTDGPRKPTISAIGSLVNLYDDDDTCINGTSASCAIVSGYIALLLEDYPNLATDKGRLIALMCVSSGYSTTYNHFTEDNGFDPLIGAGVFNYGNMIENYEHSYVYRNESKLLNELVCQKMIFAQTGDVIRACVANMAKTDGTTDGFMMTDYDVFLYSFSGDLLTYSNSYESAVDILTYTATTSGYYYMKIYQCSNRVDPVETLGYAYSVN